MSNLQFLPKSSIYSNSQFHYKESFTNQAEIGIKLPFEGEKNLQLKYNNMINLQPHLAFKGNKNDQSIDYTSFERATLESRKTEEYFKHKRQIIEDKRDLIERIVCDRNRMLKEKLENEKMQLKSVLTRIIKDSLKFSVECTPMISMMPNKLQKEMNKTNPEKIISNVNNSTTSGKKFESNSFLSELGLDLSNLRPDNINIDIDRAYQFIKRWKIKREDISEVIRMKVVNEIMNLEERRSVKRIKKLGEEIQKLKIARHDEKNEKSAVNQFKTGSKIKITENFHKKSEESQRFEKFLNFENIEKKGDFIKNKIPTSAKSNKSLESNYKKQSYKCMEKIYGSENVSSLPHFEKRRLREKCELCKHQEKYKKKFKFNAYGNVEKIVRYINSNKTLRENKNLSSHFKNIKYNKKFDDITKNLIEENNQNLI